MADISFLGKLTTLKFSLGTAAIGSHIVGMVKRSILVTSSADSSGNLVLSTLSALSLAVSLRALKIVFTLSLISST
jgi:hypothetical protein